MIIGQRLQQGFAAIAAIFLVVILAALGAFMVSYFQYTASDRGAGHPGIARILGGPCRIGVGHRQRDHRLSDIAHVLECGRVYR